MSVAYALSASLTSGGVVPVTVEADVRPGLPQFTIIGLPDRQVGEARERVRAAITNSGLKFPRGRVTVNLAPPTQGKRGTSLDLAIAVAVLRAGGTTTIPTSLAIFGELALSGAVRSCEHLPLLVSSSSWHGVVVPAVQLDSIPETIEAKVLAVRTLQDVLHLPTQPSQLPKQLKQPIPIFKENYALDRLHGHDLLKRILSIAVAGQHSVLLIGPAGSGKTSAVQAMAELLPPLKLAEQQTLLRIHALAGREWILSARPLLTLPPKASLRESIGGGNPLRPGLFSLAYSGIVFLDEFPEVRRDVRESLRSCMGLPALRFMRGGREIELPMPSAVWAAMNSCPCGLLGVQGEQCRCRPGDLGRYRQVLSDPLLDRFHICLEVPRMQKSRVGKVQAVDLHRQVIKAWEGGEVPLQYPERLQEILSGLLNKLRLSERSLQNIEAVAGTIARLDGRVVVRAEDVYEAVQYRYRPPILAS